MDILIYELLIVYSIFKILSLAGMSVNVKKKALPSATGLLHCMGPEISGSVGECLNLEL